LFLIGQSENFVTERCSLAAGNIFLQICLFQKHPEISRTKAGNCTRLSSVLQKILERNDTMKQIALAMGLLSAAVLGSTASLLAQPSLVGAQTDARPTIMTQLRPAQRADHFDDHSGPGRDQKDNDHRCIPDFTHHDRAGPPIHRLMLGSRLAAIETIIGIRTDQLDAWRNYTSALVDFFDEHPPRLDDAGPQPTQNPASSPTGENRPLFAEKIADHAIELGEKAQKLKQATQSLRSLLTPDQLEKLARVDHPPHPHSGPNGDGPEEPQGETPQRP
jgi:hypothetical protein